ncbi:MULTISPECIES: hypothetical protein [unclassified Bartonella]|uniref:hypothetical protein n=1 Tax=unclassified Bartonella TaxID=2645622 RepID=UPI002361823C|nr:hypothetical protein [Bartonella sp. CM31XJBT]
MKKLILIFLALCLTGPASARLRTISDDCSDIGGTMVRSQIINNISVIPYKNLQGVNILSVLETRPTEEPEMSQITGRTFHIQSPEIVELAYRAYSTSQFVDICYRSNYPINVIRGLRVRDN